MQSTDRSPTSEWLFEKSEQCIHIATSGECTMSVCRPGAREVRYHFRDHQHMQQFQIVLAEQLTSKGWVLQRWGTARRRTSPSGSTGATASE